MRAYVLPSAYIKRTRGSLCLWPPYYYHPAFLFSILIRAQAKNISRYGYLCAARKHRLLSMQKYYIVGMGRASRETQRRRSKYLRV